MHRSDSRRWRHGHNFLPASQRRGERQTQRVIALTSIMMIAEIYAGSVFGSMALLADGWHMASHASALGITALAYWYSRRHAENPRYSFGTWKVGVLGGYSSAITLAVIAILIAWESGSRFFRPVEIRFNEAILVACLGLVVNLVSAWMLRGHEHGEHDHHHDHNLRAAYLHVLADALTSLTAIGGLAAGKFFGWVWMDPAMGIVGSLVIARWSYGLIRDTSAVLLDGAVSETVTETVRRALEADGDSLAADLHIWRVGPRDLAAAVSVVARQPKNPGFYRSLMESEVPELSHVTVEVNVCS